MDMYQVVDTKTKKVVAIGFLSRAEAKLTRNEKNGGKAIGRHVVSRGSDHPLGPSFGPVEHGRKWWR